MICPNCGKKSKYRNPAFCESCGASFTQPVQQEVPVQQAVPELSKKKRRRVKWWMIVLPILIAALAAGGIFYARTQKQYTTASYYDEDGELYERSTYNEDGFVVGGNYLSVSYKWKLKKTDTAKAFDVSDDEQVKGVHRAECWQRVFESNGGDAFEGNVEVWCYDKDNNLILVHSYVEDEGSDAWETSSITTYDYQSGGKPSHKKMESYDDGKVIAVTETEYDGHGKPLQEETRTADGELVIEVEYENSYCLGTIRKMTLTRKTYMERDYGADATKYVVLDDPVTTTVEFKYHYTFGLLTSADAVRETDDPDAEEDIWEYRAEYEYD